jgi:hypothetical protein
MSRTEMAPAQTPEGHAPDLKLEVVVLPVTDVDELVARGVAGTHEARTGQEDPDWAAASMVRERAGEELPS